MDYLKVCSDFALPLATVFFAYQQARISELKRKDDLYDKRYRVYGKLREFAESITDKKGNFELHRKLLREAMLHEFLFKDDLNDFMKEIWKKYNTGIGAHLVCKSIIVNNDNQITHYTDDNIRNQYYLSVNYFIEEFFFELRDKFKPYLNLEKKIKLGRIKKWWVLLTSFIYYYLQKRIGMYFVKR